MILYFEKKFKHQEEGPSTTNHERHKLLGTEPYRGQTYVFDQTESSNWYHPLGFAYFPDGAHEGVDELEEGIGNGESYVCTCLCMYMVWYIADWRRPPLAVIRHARVMLG